LIERNEGLSGVAEQGATSNRQNFYQTMGAFSIRWCITASFHQKLSNPPMTKNHIQFMRTIFVWQACFT